MSNQAGTLVIMVLCWLPLCATAQVNGSVDENSGEARYAIPLVVPPGAAGLTPGISLTYGSGMGKGASGWAGFGWSIAGESRIERNTRRGAPLDYDGFTAGTSVCNGRPCFVADFVLDGADLVCDELSCTSGRYRTRVDDGRRIQYLGPLAGWEIHDRDGTRAIYGALPISRIKDGNAPETEVFAWLLERVEDVNGNWIAYTYDQATSSGTAYLTEIGYAQAGQANPNRKIVFLNEPADRPDRSVDFSAGFRREVTRRLSRIEVRAAGDFLVTAYALAYAISPDSGRSLLESVTRIGSDDATALPPHRFTYAARGADPNGIVPGFEAQATSYCRSSGSSCAGSAIGATHGGVDAFPARGIADMNLDGLADIFDVPSSTEPTLPPGLIPGPTFLYAGKGESMSAMGEGQVWAAGSHAFSSVWTNETSVNETWTRDLTLDLTGDGYPDHFRFQWGQDDVVFPGGPSGYAEPGTPWLNSGEVVFQPQFGTTRSIDGVLYTYEHGDYLSLADMDGDGRLDRVLSKNDADAWTAPYDAYTGWLVFRNEGGGFASDPVEWVDPLGAPFRAGSQNAKGVTTVDVNGDGLADRVWAAFVAYATSSDAELWVAYNDGAGFAPAERLVSVNHPTFGSDPNAPGHVFYRVWEASSLGAFVREDLIDLNGDGFLDYVATGAGFGSLYAPGPEHLWRVLFGTSQGFEPVVRLVTPGCGLAYDPWGNPVCEAGYPADAWDWTSSPGSGFADYDGDGLPDRYVFDDAFVYRNPGPLPDVLLRAVAPTGGSIAYTWAGSAEMRDAAGNPANPGLAPSRPVVREATLSDGVVAAPDSPDLRTRYHFGAGVFDRDLGEFLGFGRVSRTEVFGTDPNAPGTVTTTHYELTGGCRGQVASTEKVHGGEVLSRTVNQWLMLAEPSAAPAAQQWNACLRMAAVLESVEGNEDTRRITRTEWAYGPDPVASNYAALSMTEFGEVTEPSPDVYVDVPGDGRKTELRYTAPDPSRQLVARVSERWVEQLPAPGVKLDHQRFDYDAQGEGRVVSHWRWYSDPYGDPNALPYWVAAARIEYDTTGNPSATTGPATPDDANGFRREVQRESVYDTFVSAAISGADVAGGALVQAITYTGCAAGLDAPPGLGLPCTTTQPNGVTASFGYDVFGRVVRVEHGSGLVEIRAHVLPLPGAPARTVVTTTRDPGGANLVSAIVTDGLGRTVRSTEPGIAGETLTVDRTYDERGQLARETLPYVAESPPAALLERVLGYDPLGRLATLQAYDADTLHTFDVDPNDPWSSLEQVYFGGVSAQDRQQRTERVRDGLGRIVRVTEHVDPETLAEPLSVTTVYDVLSNPRIVRDPIANGASCFEAFRCPAQMHATVIGYDSFGRRTWINDPDAGQWRFRYDAAGLLVERVHGADQRQTFRYDEHQRVATRSFSPATQGTGGADFYYGSDPNETSYGQLTDLAAHGAFGASYHYTYDAAGRVWQWEQTTRGKRFLNSRVLDVLGRIEARWYPDGEYYAYRYDGSRLVAIDSDPSVPGTFSVLVDAEYDALGRPTRLEVGNNDLGDPNGTPAAVLERSYDAATGRLNEMRAQGRSAVSANAAFDYQFDGLGRLAQMTVRHGSADLGTRTFQYDGSGRLEVATGPWERPQLDTRNVTWSYAYDALGNLRYQRSSTGTYERDWKYEDPTRPRFLTEFEDYWTTNTLVADAAGNPASVDGATYTWNAQNRIATIAGSGRTYGYDALDRRVLARLPKTDLVFVGDDFEYDTRLGQGTKYFFVNGERIAGRAKRYAAQSASIPVWAYRWILQPLAPWMAGAVPSAALLGLLSVAALMRPRTRGWAAAPGVVTLCVALLLLPANARGVIGQAGGPKWYGSHSHGLVVYANDALGSVRAVLGADGKTLETRDYLPFGAVISRTGTHALKHAFGGQSYDTRTGMYDFSARLQQPRWGRFVSPDERVEAYSPGGTHPYAFVRNQPTSRIDPSGTQSLSPDFGLIVGTPGGSQNPGGNYLAGSGGGGGGSFWVGGSVPLPLSLAEQGWALRFGFGVSYGFFQGLGLSLSSLFSIQLLDFAALGLGAFAMAFGIGVGLGKFLGGVFRLRPDLFLGGISATLYSLIPRYGWKSGPYWPPRGFDSEPLPTAIDRGAATHDAVYRDPASTTADIIDADRALVRAVWQDHKLGVYGQLYRIGLSAGFSARAALLQAVN